MPEVRRRRVTKEAAPVSRRRDRAPVEDDEETEELDEDEVEMTTRPARKRTRTTVVVEDEDDEAEPDDDEDWDELDRDEDEPEPAPRKKATAVKKVARRRPVEEPEDDESEDEDDEPEAEPAPRRRTVAKKRVRRPETDADGTGDDEEEDGAPVRRRRARGSKTLPPGLRTGVAGVEEVRKMGGGGASRLSLTTEPVLIKILESEPFVSFRQHWASQGGGGADRPYTCIGKDCPLCDLGDNASQTVALNVLELSASQGPENKILQMGIKAWKALQEVATDKRTEKLRLQRDFFSVLKSGRGNQTQTNFRPVKERDLVDDWPELLDNFAIDELPDIIAEAKEKVFDPTIIQVSTRKQLNEVAAYLAED